MSTLSKNDPSVSSNTSSNESIEKRGCIPTDTIIDAIISRASDQISTPAESASKKHEDRRIYLANPAVTPTALAHSLWLQPIRPFRDTIIDATAGNGKDSLMLASMLFPSDSDYTFDNTNDHNDHAKPQLISIDIQQRACENTQSLLEENLPPDIIKNHIQVLHGSHAPLPSLPKESVGLICYNLGYLPGADKEAFQTQMMTTIYSLADAALLLRPGGLLSVMSYPGNGWEEHCAVNYFMEGLSMFGTRDRGGWGGFVDSIPSDYVLQQRHVGLYGGDDEVSASPEENTIRQTVKLALERVKEDGFDNQIWRVFDHRPLGRSLSPILFTGTRIK